MIDIYCPNWSKGLFTSANVLKKAIEQVSSGSITCRIIWVSADNFAEAKEGDGPPPGLNRCGAVALFIERIFDRSYLAEYQSRVLLPNPEWLHPRGVETARKVIDAVIHKTRFSVDRLSKLFPDASHYLTGFTSHDPGVNVQDYAAFSHFRGKAVTRHSQSLLDLWQRRPDFPPLSVQAYGPDIALKVGRWLTSGNINLLLDYNRSDEQYFSDLARAGLHLCTSGAEGFGHYINESRAMAALTLTLDAPPMNELITPATGILIPTTGSEALHSGVNFATSEALIEEGVERALSLSLRDREALGQAARRAYEDDRAAFMMGLQAFLASQPGLPH